MAFKDLREYIAKLEETGDLQKIDEEVDWDLEAGAIMRRCNEMSGPAPFFNKIKDYPDSHRILGSPMATFRRLAIALELDPDTPYSELIDIYNDRIKNPIKPIQVSDGPCKENIKLGDDVDLLEFPSLMIHEGDGGRYMGTWHISAIKDPDSGWVNWGMYRLMVHDRNTLGGLIIPFQHIGMLFNKYESRNEPMEIAIAIGPEPVTTFIGACSVPIGVNEADVIGGFRKEPLEIIKCETVDLMVPASAEIVIEAEVLPGVRRDEGPFGEYTGFQAGGKGPRPVIKVKAITHRNNPILTASNMGYPVDDNGIIQAVSIAAILKSELLRAGFPITGINVPPEASCTMCVVATKTPYSNIANQIAGFVWSTKAGLVLPRVVILNDDMDPTDMQMVMFAIATKCHPVRGATVIDDMPACPLNPFLTLEEKTQLKGGNVVYDCTWPLDWKKEDTPRLATFNNIYPKDIQKKVLDKWEKYGFKQ